MKKNSNLYHYKLKLISTPIHITIINFKQFETSPKKQKIRTLKKKKRPKTSFSFKK